MAEGKSIHGTCVSIGGIGFLLLGPPGSGKSDLALRLIDQQGLGLDSVAKPSQLVADDQVRLRRDGDAIVASSPVALAGRLEVRGLGVMAVPHLPEVKLAAVVKLLPAAEIDRLPDLGAARHELLGIALPLLAVDPQAASAPARLRAAADWLGRT